MFPGLYSEIFGLGERLGCVLNVGHLDNTYGHTSMSVVERLCGAGLGA